ncbi:unnamed protein product, partial [Didymodactylos carnosus]
MVGRAEILCIAMVLNILAWMATQFRPRNQFHRFRNWIKPELHPIPELDQTRTPSGSGIDSAASQ